MIIRSPRSLKSDWSLAIETNRSTFLSTSTPKSSSSKSTTVGATFHHRWTHPRWIQRHHWWSGKFSRDIKRSSSRRCIPFLSPSHPIAWRSAATHQPVELLSFLRCYHSSTLLSYHFFLNTENIFSIAVITLNIFDSFYAFHKPDSSVLFNKFFG